ncbi:MAG TPA: pilin [Burkholderiaceae bacterium]|nr:pilin [Burkholderiaceae bacterium]
MRHPATRAEHGFTLIELMIVVTIIGILASVAIPAYQDYVVRARVSEGMAMAAEFKTLIVENAGNGMASLASGAPPASATRNVQSVTIDPANGEITVTYTALVGAGSPTIVLAPRQNSATGPALAAGSTFTGFLAWNCNAAGSSRAGSAGTLPVRYAPSPCR